MNNLNLNSLVRNSARVITASLLLTAAAVAANKPYSKIVPIGDSLSDTRNAYMLTGGFYPASPPNAEGRISNGLLWVEYLAESLGMEIQPENQYAVAGACTGFGNFSYQAYSPFYPEMEALEGTGLQWQIETFLEDSCPGKGGHGCSPSHHGRTCGSGHGKADPNALYTIWIGANDIFTTLTFGGDMDATVGQATQNTADAVQKLAKRGARHILVVNLPDLGLTPFGLAQGLQGSMGLSALTNAYNYYLDAALDSLEAKGIRTIRLDAAGLIRKIAADPGHFGLENVTNMAIDAEDDPDDYLFWNEVHPTTAGHQIIADQAVKELIAFYSPRRGKGHGPGPAHSLNSLVHASGR
jgi:phospholipase/lecithinase/hemolysin